METCLANFPPFYTSEDGSTSRVPEHALRPRDKRLSIIPSIADYHAQLKFTAGIRESKKLSGYNSVPASVMDSESIALGQGSPVFHICHVIFSASTGDIIDNTLPLMPMGLWIFMITLYPILSDRVLP
ncbi:hypothetical protein SeMB42_g00745 [Synchytrium endobioticum]|uniref:Uncharacterized protein n=1 Tax=Synchytrium endobioticum TaxID=286115 RepID=A0A507DQL1_9FUNG|nr:hypothetical protein SeMB42_g00745 [Synchytrium endobioticum]